MNDIAELNRLVENLIRLGTIAEVQFSPPRVKVSTGGIMTTWLPWISPRAGADQVWDPPTAGEQVLLFSPSGQLANGVAVTGLFSDKIPANGDRTGLYRRTFADGAVIEYDSEGHHLSAVLPEGGTTSLISKGGIHFEGPITHIGDYTQTGNQTVTGEVNVSVDVVAAGISLVEHTHGGVMTGPGSTGVPQ
ncbi:phage baseplate assembly protein V [Pseudomonas kurunegalensis]|uniref:phage baseplate assembly protein V n=1 Tax=Pseudomonas kurunegalensis TaxID=485880 RepID=UPI002570959F|nr:phage baseplate assembly protein V [Pseudomonas kurunegalensis]WJD60881.1 phage baseplate assembly protein V [Pseudomonas kurunegalensis]